MCVSVCYNEKNVSLCFLVFLKENGEKTVFLQENIRRKQHEKSTRRIAFSQKRNRG